MEEVWQAIQAGKTGERGHPAEPVTLGNFLQSVGVDMPSAVSSDFNLANLGHLQEEGKVEIPAYCSPLGMYSGEIVGQLTISMASSLCLHSATVSVKIRLDIILICAMPIRNARQP